VNSHTLSQLLFDAAGKSFWLLAAALLLMLAVRRGAPALRHFIWLLVLAGLLLLPAAALISPFQSAPAWAGMGNFVEHWVARADLNQPPNLPAVANGTGAARGGVTPTVSAPAVPSGDLRPSLPRALDLRLCILWAWAAGLVATLLAFAVRLGLLRGIERASKMMDDPEFPALAETVCRELNLQRRVCFLQSAQSLMPMTWGWWRPVVLLPPDTSGWERGRLHSVLRHELGHVKRRDCLTQGFANLACALFWFNPLVWLAARQMRRERERACDDLVLSTGLRPSEYASHLLEIARHFARAPHAAAIPIARQSGLESRLRFIVDSSRKPGRLHPAAACAAALIVGAIFFAVGGCKTGAPSKAAPANESGALRQKQFEQLKIFFAVKEQQAQSLAATDGKTLIPEVKSYFAAGRKGDWRTVDDLWTNLLNKQKLLRKLDQAARAKYPADEAGLLSPYWQTIMETWGAMERIEMTAPKYTQIMADKIIHSIPAGSIYLGGTDPGRFLISAMCQSQSAGDPFFTITQNAVADPTYLDYVRLMYGGKIQPPTKEAVPKAYSDFAADTKRRYQHDQDYPNEARQIKPGEKISTESGWFAIDGMAAVMEINASITKIMFDENPNREFYIEESYPLDWTYPYLEPHGLIMKINRQPLAELSERMVDADRKYWRNLANGMIGDWLTEETTVKAVAEFADKIYVRKDLSGFTGDPAFVQNDFARQTFAQLRSTIAGVYAWRIGALKEAPAAEDYAAKSAPDRRRMAAAADFAFRQAFALCPSSTEIVMPYTHFLTAQNRAADAILVAQTASQSPSLKEEDATRVRNLLQDLQAGRAK
jgi:beta-lactamase regulating signal transducer with metallopeptidase domain